MGFLVLGVEDDSAVTLSRFAYTYDAAGNRVTRTTTNGIANYTYDALSRLTQATQPNPIDPLQTLTETFTYDPVGNRAASHLATGQLHDAANRLLEDSNFTFSYDGNGNLVEQITKITGDRTLYTYSVENQLIQVEKFTVVGGLSPVLTAVYRYDPMGRRIAREVTQAGATTVTRYVYDNEDILLELDGANAVVARYTHGPGIDEPLIMARGGQTLFYHADGLGSIWDLSDSAGTSVRSYTYDSFGQLLAQTGTLINPYTYTGRELDPETGLYYYRARYYDPRIGRFLQEDLNAGFTALPQSLNKYPYVLNNPVNLIDPEGEITIVAEAALIALVSTALFGAFIASQPESVREAQARDIANLVESLRSSFGPRELDPESLRTILDKIDKGLPITPEDLEAAQREREQLLKECKAIVGTPTQFPTPDPDRPPSDPKGRRKFFVAKILELIGNIFGRR